MTARRSAGGLTAFLDAFSQPGSGVSCVVAPWPDWPEALAAVRRLQGYRGYLAAARAFKASTPNAAGDIDKQALQAAGRALDDIQTLASSIISRVLSLSRGGALDPQMTSLRDAVQAAGTVSTVELWNHAIQTDGLAPQLAKLGIDQSLRDAATEAVNSNQIDLAAGSDSLTLTSARSPGTALTLSTAALSAPTSVSELLAGGRLDMLAAAVQRGEPAYLYGGPFGTRVRAEDVAVYGALGAYEEGLRHVRKLEDVGLVPVAGAGDPVTWFIIGLAIFAIGLIGEAAFCDPKTLGDITAGSGWCIASKIIAEIGVLVLLLAAGEAGKGQPGPSGVALTQPLIEHGVLRDLQFQSAAA
jgi:hypothetical protein